MIDNGATPVMAQYLSIKQNYQDCLVFFQMGDFYELFFDDAKIAAQELDIVLTYRGQLNQQDIPMCGVPLHNYAPYLERLVKKGFKIAVCEQVESPIEAKKRGYKSIVNRQVVRIVTAGTLVEEHLLEPRQHNYLASLVMDKDQFCVFYYDMSTGKASYSIDRLIHLKDNLSRKKPSEVIISDDMTTENISFLSSIAKHKIENDVIIPSELSDFYHHIQPLAQQSLILLLSYINRTQCGLSQFLCQQPEYLAPNDYLEIDNAGLINLEIFKTISGDKKPTLLSALDHCVTTSGGRLLSEYLSYPLTSTEKINQRYDAIEFFIKNAQISEKLLTILKKTSDIYRIMARIKTNRATPADLGHIRQTLTIIYEEFPQIHWDNTNPPFLIIQSYNNLCQEFECYPILARALKNELPISLKIGDFIAEGFDEALDDYRQLKYNTQQYILNLEKHYREITQVSSLKIKHNNLIGYHIEVSSGHSDKLLNKNYPDIHFAHKQTMASNMRFTTQELLELEKKIAQASVAFDEREKEIFLDMCNQIDKETNKLLAFAHSIACFDVFASHATLAMIRKYTRPIIQAKKKLCIEGGRHPVIESLLKNKSKIFVPNDISFKTANNVPEIWLLTGPNMGGKSTFLRQTALMIIMAQAGFYVCATRYEASIFDKVFSRVGASDNLAEGKSTFMMEMIETATILTQATSQSFVILDELGRGTSTYDGLAIAWGTLKYLSETIGALGLFATHYHELTELIQANKRIGNLQVSVSDFQGEIIFLHKIIQGSAKKSYGIHVASLAGLPVEVIQTAQSFLKNTAKNKTIQTPDISSPPLFRDDKNIIIQENPIYDLIRKIDVNHLSPLEAFSLIEKIKQEI